MPGREDEDKTRAASASTLTAKTQPAPTWAERAAQREHLKTTAVPALTAPLPPVRLPDRAPSVRVHIEEIGESVQRPELLSSPPGKTVFDAVGPREVVAMSLRAMANKFDPPWWMFWTRRRCR
jgi:hypothetical protein